MAKLNQENASRVSNATDSFEPIPDGAYHVKLMDVDSTGQGAKGPYWTWAFEVVEPGDAKGRKLWNNTSLSEAAAFIMKQTFDAFGVTPDTDTDDLLGSVCKAIVSTRTIQAGARKGELTNQVERLVPKDDDFTVESAGAASGSGGDPEDIFG